MNKIYSADEGPIDFVIIWVDGSDERWKEEKEKYAGKLTGDELARNTEARYRDMGLLKYWFRGVERFAPWVNKIHFVTCGQKPEWLNSEHPKLHLVNHSDYIPREFLPTFNSNAIELGIHRIPGLTERFVYFNDDVFLTAPVTYNFFFKKGLPRDMYEIKALVSFDAPNNINAIQLNNLGVINRHYSGRGKKLRPFFKKYSPIYSPGTNLRNFFNLAWGVYIGIGDHHLASAYRKSDFESLWSLEEDRLSNVCRNRFRTPYDLNHWVFRYRRLVAGEFEPINMKRYGKYYELGEFTDEPIWAIRKQSYQMVCLNDCMEAEQVELWTAALHEAFEAILPDKSAYEL